MPISYAELVETVELAGGTLPVDCWGCWRWDGQGRPPVHSPLGTVTHAAEQFTLESGGWQGLALHLDGGAPILFSGGDPNVLVPLRLTAKAVRARLVAFAQAGAASPPTDAVELLRNARGQPLSSLANVVRILANNPHWSGVFGYDLFAEHAVLLRCPLYSARGDTFQVRPVADVDEFQARIWLQEQIAINPTASDVSAAIHVVAHQRQFHPVRTYLDSLHWDGTPRLDTWLIDHLGAESTDYVRAVSRKTLIAAVARIYKPGCQADSVLTLCGPQGIGKSTAIRILAGDDWFSDSLPDLHSKDALQGLAGKWLIELSELSAMGKSDIEAVKRFVSATVDHYRPSYGRHTRAFPRQCLFIGSTNADDPLLDATGNRRWWPVDVSRACHFAELREVRNQLWAEAVHRFQAGERWHLTGAVAVAASDAATAKVRADAWEDQVLAYLVTVEDTNVGEILNRVFGLDPCDWRQSEQNRVARILRLHGWQRFYARVGTERVWRYRRPLVPVVPVLPGVGSSNTCAENPRPACVGSSGSSGSSLYTHTGEKVESGGDTIITSESAQYSRETSGTTGTTGTKPRPACVLVAGVTGTTGTRLEPGTPLLEPGNQPHQPTADRTCTGCAHHDLDNRCLLLSGCPAVNPALPLCSGLNWVEVTS